MCGRHHLVPGCVGVHREVIQLYDSIVVEVVDVVDQIADDGDSGENAYRRCDGGEANCASDEHAAMLMPAGSEAL